MVTSDTFLRDEQFSRTSLSLSLCFWFVFGGVEGWGVGGWHVCVVCMYMFAFLHVCVRLCVEARG